MSSLIHLTSHAVALMFMLGNISKPFKLYTAVMVVCAMLFDLHDSWVIFNFINRSFLFRKKCHWTNAKVKWVVSMFMAKHQSSG